MKYVGLIWSDGVPVPEAMAVMQRELPAWIEEMDRRGVRLLGRELELPEMAATVRVRGGETLVSDGPFAETKEFMAGFDLLDCADLDEAIEVMGSTPVSRYHPIEIRPSREEPWLGERVPEFAQMDDSAGPPYLLIIWVTDKSDPLLDGQALVSESRVWRQDVEARGLYLLGSALEGPDTATTVRVRNGETLLGDGPFIMNDAFVGGIEVVSCADRQQAIELAAAHPLARSQAIEVRPFWSE